MDIELWDMQCGFGGATPGDPSVAKADELVAEMQRVGIARAVVRTAPEDLDCDVLASNAALYAACSEHSALLPCPVVVPSTGGDLPPEAEQLQGHLRRGCAAVSIRPGRDHWRLAPWNSDALFRVLATHRVPALINGEQVGLEQIAELAARYPELPIVVIGMAYREHRALAALLQAFPRVHLGLGGACAVHGALEHLAATVGAERVLFGTGFPVSEPMAAITYLMYADLSTEQKALIGSGNAQRLLAEVRR